MKIKQSKFWDMNISVKELLDFNEFCYIERYGYSHWSDNSPSDIRIYVKHPNHTNSYDFIELGYANDGFCYESDTTIHNLNEYQCLNIKEMLELINDIRCGRDIS